MTTSGSYEESELYPPEPGTTTQTETQMPSINSETAGVAAQEVKGLGREAADQAGQVMSQVKDEVQYQADQSREKLTKTLRTLGEEMDQMASSGSPDSLPAQALRKLAESARSSADFLSQRDSGSLLSEFEQLAKRRPGMFLAGAAIAGTIAGRATRSAVDKRNSTPQMSNGAQFDQTQIHEYPPTATPTPTPVPTPENPYVAATEGPL